MSATKKAYDFIKVAESDPSLLHVDHDEYKGNLRLRKPTLQARLEHGQLLGAWTNLLAGEDHARLVERYAAVMAFVEEAKGLSISDIVDTDLLDALFEEVQRWLASFRKEAKS